MDLPRTLAELTPNERNPRKVTPAKIEALKKALDRFGDLGGVVFNVASGRLVGGHQRRAALNQTAPIHRTKEYPVPTRTGTVAEGYIEVDGEAHRYREVRWDKSTEQAANIAANAGAGDWDLPMLTEWLTELDAEGFDLSLTMLDDVQLGSFRVPDSGSGDEFDDALSKVAEGEQSDIRTVTFTLTAEQQELVMQRIAQMKALGPFVDTNNANSNGNALARLCKLYGG